MTTHRSIRTLPPREKGRLQFLYRRYASFLHQLHDYQDAVWDQAALRNDPAFQVDAAALHAVLQNADGVEEWVQSEQLMQVFDLSPRPLPLQLEIALLNDKNQAYELLLESPEPLPAARVQGITLSVARGILSFHCRRFSLSSYKNKSWAMGSGWSPW